MWRWAVGRAAGRAIAEMRAAATAVAWRERRGGPPQLTPKPYTLYRIPYTLYTLYLIPYTLYPIPYTLKTRAESAWLLRLKLNYETMLSSFASNFRPYSESRRRSNWLRRRRWWPRR
jgi:hypothetical protein